MKLRYRERDDAFPGVRDEEGYDRIMQRRRPERQTDATSSKDYPWMPGAQKCSAHTREMEAARVVEVERRDKGYRHVRLGE